MDVTELRETVVQRRKKDEEDFKNSLERHIKKAAELGSSQLRSDMPSEMSKRTVRAIVKEISPDLVVRFGFWEPYFLIRWV